MANSQIISELKNRVITDLINDDDIIMAIDCPDKDKPNWEPIYLLNTKETEDMGFTPHIFRELQNPDLITKNITFIVIEVSIPKSYGENRTWVKPTLSILIISHVDHMRVDNIIGISDNRNDYLSILIDKKFNNVATYGNDVCLISNEATVYSDKFLGRTLTFEGIDLNDSLCD